MPIARIPGAAIYYEVVGDTGPFVAVMPGARHGLDQIAAFSQAIAAHGYRVIAHDRRNCGRSSLDFDAPGGEEDIWAADLHALLNHLGVGPVMVVGKSRTARVALRFALLHPEQTRSLGLWGLSGGRVARRVLDDYYYRVYLRACRQGGMELLCSLEHFASLIAARSENRAVLLATNPEHYAATLKRWRARFLVNIDQPVMGFSDDELRSVAAPTAILAHYDRLHPRASGAHACAMIPHSQVIELDPARPESSLIIRNETPDDILRAAAVLGDFDAAFAGREAASAPPDIGRRHPGPPEISTSTG